MRYAKEPGAEYKSRDTVKLRIFKGRSTKSPSVVIGSIVRFINYPDSEKPDQVVYHR